MKYSADGSTFYDTEYVGNNYIANEKVKQYIEISKATNRPLLLQGPSGCGKSSLAAYVAVNQEQGNKKRFYKSVINTNSEAQDLFWKFDAVRRLHDAQISSQIYSDIINKFLDPKNYITPQTLWWAINPDSAKQLIESTSTSLKTSDPNLVASASHDAQAVVLIDEIDKAEYNIPNNLLDFITTLSFQVQDIPTGYNTIKLGSSIPPPIIIFTSNKERALPTPFLRRCIVLDIELPDTDSLAIIGKLHYPELKNTNIMSYATSFHRFISNTQKSKTAQPVGGTSEFLDFLLAISELPPNINTEELLRALIEKSGA